MPRNSSSSNRTPANDAPKVSKVIVTLAVEVPTAKWSLPTAPDTSAEDIKRVVEALTAAGFDADEAAAKAEAMHTAPSTGAIATAVRDDLRAAVLAAVKADERVKASGATVTLRDPWKPTKK